MSGRVTICTTGPGASSPTKSMSSGSMSGNVIFFSGKVEKTLKGSLDSILSPLPSVKIQIMGGKVFEV